MSVTVAQTSRTQRLVNERLKKHALQKKEHTSAGKRHSRNPESFKASLWLGFESVLFENTCKKKLFAGLNLVFFVWASAFPALVSQSAHSALKSYVHTRDFCGFQTVLCFFKLFLLAKLLCFYAFSWHCLQHHSPQAG